MTISSRAFPLAFRLTFPLSHFQAHISSSRTNPSKSQCLPCVQTMHHDVETIKGHLRRKSTNNGTAAHGRNRKRTPTHPNEFQLPPATGRPTYPRKNPQYFHLHENLHSASITNSFFLLLFFMLAAVLMAAVAVATLTPASSASPTPSDPQIQPFITVPLAVQTGDNFYNALITDAAGSELGVRLDLLQPDIWLMNGNLVVACDVLNSYYNSLYSTATSYLDQVSFTYSGTVWAATECQMAGAYYPVTTTSENSASSTPAAAQTPLLGLASAISIPYPNGVVAEGHIRADNFSIGTTDNTRIELDNFSFLLADETNMFAGGLGLANNPHGLGLLDTLVASGKILSRGYLTYFSGYSDTNTTAGELLLGAVNQKYYSGNFYQFPVLPYVGLDGARSTLPIVLLDGFVLENLNTSQLVSLSVGLPEPFVLDSRLSYSYIPLSYIVNLAVQTNAFYNLENNRWIVKCLDFQNSNALLHFKFGPLTVKIPLTALIVDAYYGDSFLYFSTGVRACFLNVLPSSDLGYSSLGLPFLTNIYLAMDNDGGQVAMANANGDLDLEQSDFSFLDSPSALPTAVASASNVTSSTVAYIQSGTIPFATKANYSSTSVTMTFFTASGTGADAVLARFSGVTIVSGEVYITGAQAMSTGASASAANARTSSGSNTLLTPFNGLARSNSWALLWVGFVGLVGVVVFV